MYPKISDFFNDIFGTHIVLPIQSFGFFVALAFLAAFAVINREYLRMTANGIFGKKPTQVRISGPMSIGEVALNFLIYFVVGYKLGLFIEDWGTYAKTPQLLFSPIANGSLLWGMIAALAGGGYHAYLFQQKRNEPEKFVTRMHGMVEDSGTMFTLAFIFGIAGAKLFHNFEYWDEFLKHPMESLTSFDGLTFYGGLICAGIVIIAYCWKKGYNVLGVADSTLPAVLLAYGIGRMGCHIAGDGDWGIANLNPNPGLPDWLWAYSYPHNVLSDGEPIAGCVGQYCNQLVPPVYPTPLYECLICIGLFGIIWAIRKKVPYLGQITGIYLMFNGLERFLIEKIRVNVEIPFLGMKVTQAEIISTVLFLAGVSVFVLATFVWKKSTKVNVETAV